MMYFGQAVMFILYLIGEVLLFEASHWIWGIFGLIIPIIPWVYSVIVLVDKFVR